MSAFGRTCAGFELAHSSFAEALSREESRAHAHASLFCLATSGTGFGTRLKQAAVSGCIPLVIDDHVRVCCLLVPCVAGLLDLCPHACLLLTAQGVPWQWHVWNASCMACEGHGQAAWQWPLSGRHDVELHVACRQLYSCSAVELGVHTLTA